MRMAGKGKHPDENQPKKGKGGQKGKGKGY